MLNMLTVERAPEVDPFDLPLGEAAEPVRLAFREMAEWMRAELAPSGHRARALDALENSMLLAAQAANAEARG
jgi:hypothetical protein